MKPGIYPDLSNAEYHGGEGVSKSVLDLMARSPMHAKCRLDAANDNEPTAAQAFGTAFHTLILEPHLFVKHYTLGLRQSDVPDAIDSREVLVQMAETLNAERELLMVNAVNGADDLKMMIAELNKTRLPKLKTSGSKPDLIASIKAATIEQGGSFTEEQAAELETFNGASLKLQLKRLTAARPGLLSSSGSNADLAATLRAAGEEFQTRQEITDAWLAEKGSPMFIDTKSSMSDLAAALRLNGIAVTLWAEVKEEWLKNNGERIVLEPQEWDALQGMRAAVEAHPAASALLMGKPGKAEQSAYWIDRTTGELCRCRPDFWREDNVLVDLKTTDDASPEGFAKSIANWRYHVQAPFYRDGVEAVTGKPVKAFAFVAVEKKAPYAVGVYVLDQVSEDIGRAEYKKNLTAWAACRASGIWPGYSQKVEAISLPQWVISKNADAIAAA